MGFVMTNQYFEFLSVYGYRFVQDESDTNLIFSGQNNKVIIVFSEYAYEISCQFVDKQTQTGFSLQDALAYQGIDDLKGTYQIPDKNDLLKGLNYIAAVIQRVFSDLDISNLSVFEKVYNYTIEKRNQDLNEYYIKEELKKADTYWREKKYSEAIRLYQKNVEYLSRSQQKKSKYVILR